MSSKRLYKGREKVICGVCSGIAEYVNIDPTIVRLLAVVLLLVNPAATVLGYIIACAIVPERPREGPAEPSGQAQPRTGVYREVLLAVGVVLLGVGVLSMVCRLVPACWVLGWTISGFARSLQELGELLRRVAVPLVLIAVGAILVLLSTRR